MHQVGPNEQGTRRIGIGLALAAAVISGFSVYVNAQAVRAFGDPLLYTTIKNLIAAAGLLALVSLMAARLPAERLTRPRGARAILGLAFIGVVGGGIAFALFFAGLAQTAVASAGFIQKSLVIWVAILAVVLLRERFGLWHVLAIALLVAGQIASLGSVALPAMQSGEAMIFAATLLWSLEVIVAKRLLAQLSPLTVGLARMGGGGAVLVAFAIGTGATASLASLTLTQWAWVALTGVILTAYVAVWLSALARAQATDVTAMLVFGAVITAVVSSGGQLEGLAPNALGFVLIAAGTAFIAVLATRSQRLVRQPQM
ncbi:MAG: DMT family transporter [Chloroflexota bacterium]|nr:DMT family transporter [Chloroflexota bacterium]